MDTESSSKDSPQPQLTEPEDKHDRNKTESGSDPFMETPKLSVTLQEIENAGGQLLELAAEIVSAECELEDLNKKIAGMKKELPDLERPEIYKSPPGSKRTALSNILEEIETAGGRLLELARQTTDAETELHELNERVVVKKKQISDVENIKIEVETLFSK
ncbi:hypothetical protein EDC01DRAFT_630759 [Geopyxis carbonaria]|nr:hypothetical protein EDC01DRAFT_630759 [Geopyxis carbonaria]